LDVRKPINAEENKVPKTFSRGCVADDRLWVIRIDILRGGYYVLLRVFMIFYLIWKRRDGLVDLHYLMSGDRS
jgi:hypothetical protein